MRRLGILAYGSLIEEPGEEIEPIIRERISSVETPFCIEFARSSSTRDGAPTVIPVESGGARVRATIFILDENTSIETAQDLLWRRETRNESTNKHYKRPASPNSNSMVIEQIAHFKGVKTVLYAKLGANITDLTPEKLSDLAIRSAKGNAGKKNKDGILYLISLKRQGIVTPLMLAYEEAILKKTNTPSLEDALTKIRNHNIKHDA